MLQHFLTWHKGKHHLISNKQPFFVYFVSAGVVGEAIFKKIPQGVIIDPAGTSLSFTAFEDHGPLPEWSLGTQMAGEVWVKLWGDMDMDIRLHCFFQCRIR